MPRDAEPEKAVEQRGDRRTGDENTYPGPHRLADASNPEPTPKPAASRAPLEPKRPNPLPPLRNMHLVHPARAQDGQRAAQPVARPPAAPPVAGRLEGAASTASTDLDSDPFAHPAVQAKLDHFQKEIATLQDNYVALAHRLEQVLPGTDVENEMAHDDEEIDPSAPLTKRRKTSTSTSTSTPLSPEDDALLAAAAGRLVYLYKPFLSESDLDALEGVVSARPVRVRDAVELRRTVRGLLPEGARWDALTREELVVLQHYAAVRRRRVTYAVRLHLAEILGVRVDELVGEAGDTKRAELVEEGGLAWTCAEVAGRKEELRGEAVTRAIAAILYGPRAISMTTAADRRTAGKSSKGAVWAIDVVKPQLVAFAVTIVTSCLRNEKQFILVDDARNANFVLFHRVVERLGSSASSSRNGERILEELGRQLIPELAQPGHEEAHELGGEGPSDEWGSAEQSGQHCLDSDEDDMVRPTWCKGCTGACLRW
ncbi:hypothetical protein JCM8208_007163 [Rhodotorula glutinis]